MATLQGKPDLIWLQMQSELLSYKKRLLEAQNTHRAGVVTNNPFVNIVNGRGTMNQPNQGQGRSENLFNNQHGGHCSRNQGRGRSWFRPICQVCTKIGHTANVCYNQFHKNFVSNLGSNKRNSGNNPRYNNGKAQVALVTANSNNPFISISDNGIDPNWYTDGGATNHVTSEYNNLMNLVEYEGKELVTVG